jgi:hypothetical protein
MASITLMFSIAIGRAQTDSATREPRIEDEVTRWRLELTLTDEQTSKVRAIMTEQKNELDRSSTAIERAPEADREQMATDLENRLRSFDARYDAVFAPWQQARAHGRGLYDAHVVIVLNWWPWWFHWHPFWHPDHRWHRHHHPPHHPFPPHHPQPPIPPRPGPRPYHTEPRHTQPQYGQPEQDHPQKPHSEDSKPEGPRRQR